MEVGKLKHEREQVMAHWAAIDYTRLVTIAAKIKNAIAVNTPYKVVGDQIRQFHNVIGYKAKDTLAKGGVCSGALYRIAEFINTLQENRIGKKSCQNPVHIEHTIPVREIYNILLSTGTNYTDEQYVCVILKNSIATAMLGYQGHTISKNNPGGVVLAEHASKIYDPVRPFMRYTAQSVQPEIYNVLTSAQIDVTLFTMQDFHNDLLLLLTEVSAPYWLIQEFKKV